MFGFTDTRSSHNGEELHPEKASEFTLRGIPHQRITVFQAVILASSVVSKVTESWLSKRTSVRKRGIGALTIPKAVIHSSELTQFFPSHQHPTPKPTVQANFIRNSHLFPSHSGVCNSSLGCLWENVSSRSAAVKTFFA